MRIEILWFLLSSVQYLVVSGNQSSRKPNKIIFVWVIFSHGCTVRPTSHLLTQVTRFRVISQQQMPCPFPQRSIFWELRNPLIHSQRLHLHLEQWRTQVVRWLMPKWGPINAVILISHCECAEKVIMSEKGSSTSNFLLVLFWFCCFFSNISRWNYSQLQQWRRCQLTPVT